jgi:hypothetical protein
MKVDKCEQCGKEGRLIEPPLCFVCRMNNKGIKFKTYKLTSEFKEEKH